MRSTDENQPDTGSGGSSGGPPQKGERSKWAIYVVAAFVTIVAVSLLFR